MASCAAPPEPGPTLPAVEPEVATSAPVDSAAFAAALARLRGEAPASAERPWPVASRELARPVVDRERPRSLGARLRTTEVPGLVIEDEESLRAVVDAVADATGLPLVVSAGAETAAFDAGAVFDLNLTRPLAAKNVLNLVTDQAGEDVLWIERHGVVMFVTQEKASAEKVVRVHDTRRLTFPRTDFTGPRIDRLRLLDELEDDDGGSPFSGPIESVSWLTPDEVMESVVEFVAPTTWEHPGVSIDVIEGGLVVVHTAEVQREVARFLRQLGDG